MALGLFTVGFGVLGDNKAASDGPSSNSCRVPKRFIGNRSLQPFRVYVVISLGRKTRSTPLGHCYGSRFLFAFAGLCFCLALPQIGLAQSTASCFIYENNGANASALGSPKATGKINSTGEIKRKLVWAVTYQCL